MIRKSRLLGKIFPLLAMTILTASCNFFGKQLQEPTPSPPGSLADGTSIVGTWSYSFASLSPVRNPATAVTTSYTFEANGSVRIEVRSLKKNGVTCVGSGQYRSAGGKDFLVFITAASPATCGFNPQFKLINVAVHSRSMTFTDDAGYAYDLFSDSGQAGAPIGVWDMHAAGGTNGNNGIDYLVIDPRGYFVMQTTVNASQYQLIGEYKITNGAISFKFFDDFDPNNTSPGNSLDFVQFVTDGTLLQLIGQDAQGQYAYTGERL